MSSPRSALPRYEQSHHTAQVFKSKSDYTIPVKVTILMYCVAATRLCKVPTNAIRSAEAAILL